MGRFFRDMLDLVNHNKQNSFATHKERMKTLLSFAKFCETKFHLETLDQVKFRHIEAQVNAWKEKGLAASTMHTDLSFLRWMVERLDKRPMLDVIRERIELPARHPVHRKNLAWEEKHKAAIDRIKDPHVRMCLKLELAFGLRAEESRKFQPHEVDKGDKVVIHRGTKGGKERTIPILASVQRELLEEAKKLVKPGDSMIPKRYTREISFVHYFYKTIRRAGISKKALGVTPHGQRHGFTHGMFEVLTGAKVLKDADGKIRYENYPSAEKDLEARRLIAAALGHERVDITYVYLPKP